MECWYMIYKNLLYTGMLFVVLPVWFGLLWVWYLKIEGTVRKLCNAWVLGLASMFASGQILLVPMILGKRTLTEAVTPVSYTHLDVYKRQGFKWRNRCPG